MRTMVLCGSVDSPHGHLVISHKFALHSTHDDSPQGHFATTLHKGYACKYWLDRLVTWPMRSRLERWRSWPQYVWFPLSRKLHELDSWLLQNTYTKWHLRNEMVTWPMTSHNPERSRSWSMYISIWISRKRLEIEVRFQWDTNRKLHMADRLVTWPMPSCDIDRSRSWPKYIWGPLSRKRLEIEARLQ